MPCLRPQSPEKQLPGSRRLNSTSCYFTALLYNYTVPRFWCVQCSWNRGVGGQARCRNTFWAAQYIWGLPMQLQTSKLQATSSFSFKPLHNSAVAANDSLELFHKACLSIKSISEFLNPVINNIETAAPSGGSLGH